MKKYIQLGILPILLFILDGCRNTNNSQAKSENKVKVESIREKKSESENKKYPSNLIPDGYIIFEKMCGDLNKDGLNDSILIIKGTNKEEIVHDEYRGELDRNRRGIMVFFSKNDQWELGVKNINCFSSENEDGGVYFAPELSFDISKGNLYIHYHHGRYGNWKYTFRFKKSDFELIGYDSSENFGPVTKSEISINYLTKRKLKRINTNLKLNTEESGDEVFEETWEDIEQNQIIQLSEIEDFDELNLSL